MATHCSILAWRTPWTEEPAGYSPWGPTESDMTEQLTLTNINIHYLIGNQSWVFNGSTDAEAEAPILWPPDEKNWLIGKDSDARKDWRQEEKMVGWHHRLGGHEFEQAPGVGDGQGGLMFCSPWGRKESDTTEWLNWIECTLWKSLCCTPETNTTL